MTVAKQELRVDVLTGRQVIVASGRNARPQATSGSPPSARESYDPFLTGNEHDTPDERLVLRRTGTAANAPGWLLRVVPNRYPAVCARNRVGDDRLSGIHDVAIECPDGRTRLAELNDVEIGRVLFAWQLRIRQLQADESIKAISVFRNEGHVAGASLPHCHSQILAANFFGRLLQERVQQSLAFAKRGNGALFDAWLQSEQEQGARMVAATERFITVCPYASRVSRHVRVVPADDELRRFTDLSSAHLMELASRIRAVLNCLRELDGDFDHNLILVLPPTGSPTLFPWSLDLLPRRERVAGFELLTDTDIVTIAPETTAQQLRDAMPSEAPKVENEARICPAGYEWIETDSGNSTGC